MRSSKSRSRSKSNRPRSMGNIVNRVFDSSGPEGKVRGTPQQIIDKYLILARDAQLSNDRVAAENFLQHAEHYLRMLGEAQREMGQGQDQRRDDDERDHGQGNGNNGNGRGDHRQDNAPGHQGGRPDQNRDNRDQNRDREQRDNRDQRDRAANPPRPAQAETAPPATPAIASDANEVIEVAADDDGGSTLVETPETSTAPQAPARDVEAAPSDEAPVQPPRNRRRSSTQEQPALFEAAEGEKPAEKPKRRYTRKPKAEAEKKPAAE